MPQKTKKGARGRSSRSPSASGRKAKKVVDAVSAAAAAQVAAAQAAIAAAAAEEAEETGSSDDEQAPSKDESEDDSTSNSEDSESEEEEKPVKKRNIKVRRDRSPSPSAPTPSTSAKTALPSFTLPSFSTVAITVVGLLLIVGLVKLLTLSKWDLFYGLCAFCWKYPVAAFATVCTLMATPRLIFGSIGRMFNGCRVYQLDARSVTTGHDIQVMFATPVAPWTGPGKTHWIGLYPRHETQYSPATFRASFWSNVQTGTPTVLNIPTGTAQVPSGAYKIVLFEGLYNVKRIVNVNVCDEAQANGCAVM